ncbi:MAG TPA: hypothetical protein VFK05_36570 [Polyangiaceae bacterium]|nr:hypothetical protein [Polyangiaceae bacterium]
MNWLFGAALLGVFATNLAACSPGYMKASELESKHQGPADCEARCAELGMRMGALVLVSDTLPGCVCQPKPAPAVPTVNPGPAPASTPSPAPAVTPGSAPNPGPAPLPSSGAAPISDASQDGASAATTSYAVLAAAAAVRANQTDQQRRAQQSYIPQ